MSGAIDAETARKMRIAPPKVVLVGSERQPIGTRVSDQKHDELIEISVIIKPKLRAAVPHNGWNRSFSRKVRDSTRPRSPYDLQAQAIRKSAQSDRERVADRAANRKLKETAADMISAFEVGLDHYEYQGDQ